MVWKDYFIRCDVKLYVRKMKGFALNTRASSLFDVPLCAKKDFMHENEISMHGNEIIHA